MVYYLVLTRYVVAQSLHGCLYCTVVPLCKLFNYRHHKHASFKQTKRANTVICEVWWSTPRHRSISGIVGHFISWDAPRQMSVQGEKISVNFCLYSKPVSYHREDADARGVHRTVLLLQHWMLLLKKQFSIHSRMKIKEPREQPPLQLPTWPPALLLFLTRKKAQVCTW